MLRFNIPAVLLSVTAAVALSCSCGAQPATQPPTATPPPALPYPAHPLPSTDVSGGSYPTVPLAPTQTPAAFSFSTEGSPAGKSIEYRSSEQMSDEDRALTRKAEPAIRDATTFAGIDFDRGKWNYQQLACTALPEHVLLLYTEDNGAGDVTLFSAAIPRGSNGRVRIIPLERRGFAPFSPAPVNGLAIAAFNRIRADEAAAAKPDWLATALCYAALTGPRPAISPQPRNAAATDFAVEFTPTIEIEKYGGSTVRFVDVAAPRQPMLWALTFDPTGQLVKVDHSAALSYPVKAIP